jgi:hypothetical protein
MNGAQRAEARRRFSARLDRLHKDFALNRSGIRDAVDTTDDWLGAAVTGALANVATQSYRAALPGPFKVAADNNDKDLMLKIVMEERVKNGVN